MRRLAARGEATSVDPTRGHQGELWSERADDWAELQEPQHRPSAQMPFGVAGSDRRGSFSMC